MAWHTNKVGMMHENKGQHIGKAPSLHTSLSLIVESHSFIYVKTMPCTTILNLRSIPTHYTLSCLRSSVAIS